MATTGAGEPVTPISPEVLFSLPPLLLLLSALLWLFEVVEPFEGSPSPSSIFVFGARQEGISQVTPVNVLRRNPDLVHFLQGLPVLSRARSPALMAPWLALGPSLWLGPGAGPFGFVCTIVPSSLRDRLELSFERICKTRYLVTHALGFFFGPGRAFTFTGSSTPAPSSRFDPVFGLDGSFFTVSSVDEGAVFVATGAGVSLDSDLGSSWCGRSEGVANVDVDKGDFFFGADFEGADSWGKRNSRALGNSSRMTREGFVDLGDFSVAEGVDNLVDEPETRR